MPRRKQTEVVTPEVGVRAKRRKIKNSEIDNVDTATIAMMPHGNSNKGDTLIKPTSVRQTRVKRKINFRTFNDIGEKESLSGINNNAQIVQVEHGKIESKQTCNSSKVNKVIQHHNNCKEGYVHRSHVGQNQSKKNSDGIQVTVNSDEEEELDYDDVLLTEGDDIDSFCGEVKPDDTRITNLVIQTNKKQQEQPTRRELENSQNDTDGGDHEHDSQMMTDSALILGATSASMNEEEQVMSNPHLKKLFNKMLDERIKKANEAGETSTSQILTSMTPKNSKRGKEIIKSPSDTTVYVPALQKVVNKPNVVGLHSQIPHKESIDLMEVTGQSPIGMTNNTKVIEEKTKRIMI